MSCQSCQLTWRSCRNPVHIDHQYWRKGRHAGVRQWPLSALSENHYLHSLHPCQIRSMKSVSFAMLKAEKAWAWQTPQTLCWEDSLVADAAVLRLRGILSLPGIMLPVPVQGKNEQSIEQLLLCRKNTSTCAIHGKNEQSIEQLLPCQKNTSTCASSMSCQSCQLMWPSCSNPVHIDHQYWRKGRHGGVSQWPLCENHCLQSLHPRQSSDQRIVSPSWTLADAANLVSRGFLVADAAVSRLPGISSLPGIMLPVPVQGKNEQSIEQILPFWRNISTCPSSMSCQSCQFMWHSCSNPVHIDHQHRTESTHAGVASDHCERTIPFLVSILDKRVSPSHCWKPRKLEFGRHLKPCVGKTFGRWRCCVTTHLGWGSGLWQEWAQHAALPGFHNRSMTLSRVSDLR